MGLKTMQTPNGTEYTIGKSENNNLVIQIGDDMAEITSIEITDSEVDNIDVSYIMTENFNETLIPEIMADILNQEAVLEQLKIEKVSVDSPDITVSDTSTIEHDIVINN